MSIFADIVHKIFPPSHPAIAAVDATGATSQGAPAPSMPRPATPAPVVDVEQVLSGLAQKSSEKLNWRTSIVDLMKLLGLDSSQAARKNLATELHYPGDPADSAAMNIWLQKQVMTKLAENGGKVPESLKH